MSGTTYVYNLYVLQYMYEPEGLGKSESTKNTSRLFAGAQE